MPPTSPTPDGDRLLDRLAAAGPVLDELYREAAHPLPDTDDRHGRGRGPHRPGRGRPGSHPRRHMLVALIVLLVVGVAAGIVAFGSGHDDPGVIKTNTPTTVLTDAELAELVKTRVVGTNDCGPMPRRDQVPVTWPEDWDMVGGFGPCLTGYVHDASGTKTLVPVYPTAEETVPIAYWSPDTGWITVGEYRDPGFDVERYRAAYMEVRAQVADGSGGH